MKERNVELIRMAIADEYEIKDEDASKLIAEVTAVTVDATINNWREIIALLIKDEIGG